MKYKLILALCVLFSTQALANEWSSSTKVKEVIAGYKEGVILFSTEKTHHNPGNCSYTSLYSISRDEADLDMMLSILLSAQRSGSEVQIGVDAKKCGTLFPATGRINVTRVKSL